MSQFHTSATEKTFCWIGAIFENFPFLLEIHAYLLFNRPGVAGAVLQTPLSLFNRPGVAGAVLQTALPRRTAPAKPGLLKLDGVGPIDNRPSTD